MTGHSQTPPGMPSEWDAEHSPDSGPRESVRHEWISWGNEPMWVVQPRSEMSWAQPGESKFSAIGRGNTVIAVEKLNHDSGASAGA